MGNAGSTNRLRVIAVTSVALAIAAAAVLANAPSATGTSKREIAVDTLRDEAAKRLAQIDGTINVPGLDPAVKERALAALTDLSVVSHEQMFSRVRTALTAKNKVEEVKLASELADHFRRQYLRAEGIARGGD